MSTGSWSVQPLKKCSPRDLARSARDFPVFLHPKTGEEYALARTERKSGRGYGGFTFHASPEVTL